MQFEFNPVVCNQMTNEIQKIENQICRQREKLWEEYNYIRSSANASDKELARKIKSELCSIENETQKLSVLRKSLAKVVNTYINNEKNLAALSENTNERFHIKLEPLPIKPIKLKDMISSVNEFIIQK